LNDRIDIDGSPLVLVPVLPYIVSIYIFVGRCQRIFW
jgi:hypothetical protein